MKFIIDYWIGLLAGIGTTFSFLPQVIHIYKHNSIESISPYLMSIHTFGVTSWIIYGYMRDDFMIILFNSITLLLLFFIIFKYFKLSL